MRRLRRVLLHAALILGAFFALGPLVWMVSASFMQSGQATTLPPRPLPHPATLEQYRQLAQVNAILAKRRALLEHRGGQLLEWEAP